MCLLREFWTIYRTSELQNRIYTPQFEQILISLKRAFAFSHSLGRKQKLRGGRQSSNLGMSATHIRRCR
jgi:hypothetical protein